ncbi:Ref family recombination enhancement nuclease [Pantoea sp. LMR881]|nr:Ref family recombination enhancement nuclease [Pantoea sp. LMR881]MCZ4061176.1 Ref family recombination enhancement nuclease [Pantoea sp. LMR881]
MILPLCVYHHQHAAPLAVRTCYPWLVPVHACGNVGGRVAFEKHNNTQGFLLELCHALIQRMANGLVLG